MTRHSPDFEQLRTALMGGKPARVPLLELAIAKNIKEQFNITIIYVTHDHKEAFAISDKIIVLNNGKIEAQGNPEEIKSSENEYVKYFLEYLHQYKKPNNQSGILF